MSARLNSIEQRQKGIRPCYVYLKVLQKKKEVVLNMSNIKNIYKFLVFLLAEFKTARHDYCNHIDRKDMFNSILNKSKS